MRKGCAKTGFVLFVLCLLLMFGTSLFAQQRPAPIIHQAEAFVVSPPLRELAKMPVFLSHGSGQSLSAPHISRNPVAPITDSFEQRSPADSSNFSIGLNFLGLGNGFPNFTPSSAPPDTSLAVGDTQIVQWTDPVFAVFDKSSGDVLAGPILGNTIWSSLSGACADATAGIELIVQWDKVNHRWLLAENTVNGPPYYSCVAVSTSADALGSYYFFQFPQGTPLPDSPKWSIWSNGYYQSQGEYSNSGFIGPELCAYNSAKLVVGDESAEQICFILSPADGLPLPADIDSSIAPPANEDEFFMSLWDPTHLSLYSLHPDYQDPQNSTVTGNNGSQLITVPAFTPACNGNYDGNCVPQEGTSTQLQVLGDRLMYRLAYWEDTPLASVKATPPRPLPSQHWYVLHDSTASGGNEAPRWYEFTAPIRAIPVTGISLFQSGTFAPDSNYRWMGSIARDKQYDILLGYSESSASTYPSIAVTGRVVTDPLGTMENELPVINGTGSALGPHWGEYSAMRIDPDGCTFWYANEYYITTGSEWSTQIASVTFAGCQ
jgi:hypothetical protein